MTTSHVEMIACACSDRLRELILDDCVAAVTDAAVARLAALRRLQRLSLRGCTQFSDIGLRMLGSGVRADKAVETGASGYKRRTRGMYAALGAALGAHTPGFANLRALRLDGCVQLTDESMLEIASRCPHLTELGLRGCAGISDRSVCAFGRNGSLLIADFALASAVTDTGACAVGRSCPLTMLSLSASAATDFALRALAQYAKASLISLEIVCAEGQSAKAVTTSSLLSLMGACDKLERLNLGGRFPQLTDADGGGAIRQLKELCPETVVQLSAEPAPRSPYEPPTSSL